jgi:hypothetical protein
VTNDPTDGVTLSLAVDVLQLQVAPQVCNVTHNENEMRTEINMAKEVSGRKETSMEGYKDGRMKNTKREKPVRQAGRPSN